MKYQVISQPYPDITELEAGWDCQFQDSKGTTEGFLLSSDIRAIKLLNLKNFQNYFHLPGYSQFIQKRSSWKKIKTTSESLKVKLPEKAKMIFSLAEKEGIRLYLVGGAVRDLLLKRVHREEWDFIIPKKLDAFLNLLITDQRIKIRHYPEYFTVNFKFADGSSIDLARPRYEYYSPPGKVNKINRASLFQDLIRRDFTINSMVLFPEGIFYKLVDLFGGIKDIQDKKIRLLRAYGFMEDPLRILRAIRYAVTLDFQLAKREAGLLVEAVEKVASFSESYLDTRFGRELKLLLNLSTERLADMVDQHPFLGLLDFRLKTVKGENIRKLYRLREISPENDKPSRGDTMLLFLLSYLEKETAVNLLRKLNLKVRQVNYQNFMKYMELSVEQIIQEAPLKDINLLVFIHLAKSDFNLEECEKKYQRLLKDVIKTEDLLGLGFSPGPSLEKIIREIKLLSYNGYLKDREEALRQVKNNYL